MNDVKRGGRTIFPAIGLHPGFERGAPLAKPLDFYEDPRWAEGCRRLAVAPETGRAVVHFPAALPAAGGRTDGNALHLAEPPESGDKFVLQQFVSSCATWRVDATSRAAGRLSATTI